MLQGSLNALKIAPRYEARYTSADGYGAVGLCLPFGPCQGRKSSGTQDFFKYDFVRQLQQNVFVEDNVSG